MGSSSSGKICRIDWTDKVCLRLWNVGLVEILEREGAKGPSIIWLSTSRSGRTPVERDKPRPYTSVLVDKVASLLLYYTRMYNIRKKC